MKNTNINEVIERANKAFATECNRVYYIGRLERIAQTNTQAQTLLNKYNESVCSLYPIERERHTATNPNAKTENAIHNFALMDAKTKSYITYENAIKYLIEAIDHNEKLLKEVMKETGATREEAEVMAECGCETLEEAQEYIRCAEEYEVIKQGLIDGGMDEDEADEIAEDMTYCDLIRQTVYA